MEAVFGSPISEGLDAARKLGGADVNLPIVPHCVLAVLKGRSSELDAGAYIGEQSDPEVTGESAALSAKFKKGEVPDMSDFRTASISTVLVQWLQSLPEPMVPLEHCETVLEVFLEARKGAPDNELAVAEALMRVIIHTLPEPNRLLIEAIVGHLGEVGRHTRRSDEIVGVYANAFFFQPGMDEDDVAVAKDALQTMIKNSGFFSDLHNIPPITAEDLEKKEPCRGCSCMYFVPDRFVDTLCQDCGHLKTSHDIVEEVKPEEIIVEKIPITVNPATEAKIKALRTRLLEEGGARSKLLTHLTDDKDEAMRHPSPAQLRWEAVKTAVHRPEDATVYRCLKKNCACNGFQRNKFMFSLCKMCGHERDAHETDETLEEEYVDPVQHLLDLARSEAERIRKKREEMGPRYWSPMRSNMSKVEAKVSSKRGKTDLKCQWCNCTGFLRSRFNANVCGGCGHPRDSHEVDPDILLEQAAGEVVNDLIELEKKTEEEDLEKIIGVQLMFKRRLAVKKLHILRYEKNYLESTIAVQSLFRRQLAVREAQRLREERRRNHAATRIQTIWRMKLAVMALQRLRDRKALEDKSRLIIQRVYRGHVGRSIVRKLRREKLELESSKLMQRVYRGHVGREIVRKMRREKLEHESAIILQKIFRGYVGRIILWRLKREKYELQSAIRMQKVFRGHKDRKYVRKIRLLKQEKEAATCVQCAWRSGAARSELKKLRRQKLELDSAMKIERVARGYAGRKAAKHVRRVKLAIMVQCAWRSKKARREFELLRNKDHMMKAAISIQRLVRGHLARVQFRHLLLGKSEEQGAIVFQRIWRGHAVRKHEREALEMEKEEKSAVLLQSMYRGHSARKELEEQRKIESETQAAISIQKRVRGAQARAKTEKLREAAKFARAVLILQLLYRRLIARRELEFRKEEVSQEQAAVKLQKVYRGHKGAKIASEMRRANETDQAAILIQRIWRGLLTRKFFERLCLAKKEQDAALSIQSVFRGHQARSLKNEMKEELLLANAATTLQRAYRGHVARKHANDQRQSLEEAKLATYIQCAWRSLCARRELQSLRQSKKEQHAAVVVQRIARGHYARLLFKQEKEKNQQEAAALMLQCAWRTKMAKSETNDLRKQKKEEESATLIQSVYRGMKARKVAGKEKQLSLEEASAKRIQEQWLGYHKRRRAVTTVIEKAEKVKREKAATMIQSGWRMKKAKGAVRLMQQEYERKLAAIKIQSMWRTAIASRDYKMLIEQRQLHQKRSATIIQRRLRGLTARKTAEDLKKLRAVLKMQAIARGYLTRKVFDVKYADIIKDERNAAAVKIQSIVRMHFAVEERKELFEEWAATVIQSYWRGASARMFASQLDHERQRIRSAIIIQSSFRASQARTFADVVRRLFRHGRYATKIQKIFRGYRDRKWTKQALLELSDNRLQSVRLLQRVIRGWLARVRYHKMKSSKQQQLAALFVQKAFRGFTAKKMRHRLHQDRDRNLAARIIQRKFRGYLLLLNIDRSLAAKKAALLIQAVFRGRLARIRTRLMMDQIDSGMPLLACFHRICDNDLSSEAVVYCKDCGDYVGYAYCGVCSTYIHLPPPMRAHRIRKLGPLQTESAILIQSIVRMFLAKCVADHLRDERDLLAATRYLQQLARSKLAIMRARKERELARRAFPLFCDNCTESRATLRCDHCERFFCGVCSRFLHKPVHKRKHHIIPFAEYQVRMAVQIQKIIRGYLVRCRVKHVKDDMHFNASLVMAQAMFRRKLAVIRARKIQEALREEFEAERQLADGKGDLRRSKQITRTRPCQNCYRAEAVKFCSTCDLYFCGICSIQLHKHPAWKRHNMMHISKKIELLAAVRMQAVARVLTAKAQRRILTKQKQMEKSARIIQRNLRMFFGKNRAHEIREHRATLCQHCLYSRGNKGQLHCVDCFMLYCNACSAILHRHVARREHRRVPYHVVEGKTPDDALDAALQYYDRMLAGEVPDVARVEAAALGNDQHDQIMFETEQTDEYVSDTPGPSELAALGPGAHPPPGVSETPPPPPAKVEAVDLSGMSFSVVPSDLWSRSTLQHLNLSNNSLQEIPDDISRLPNLVTLDLSCNRLEYLPSEIASLKELKNLNLTQNGLREVPLTIEEAEKLEVLILTSNRLVSLPVTLPHLQCLDISNNGFESLPSALFTHLAPSLDVIDLSGNRLKELPLEIGSCQNLTVLRLDYNEISELPDTIGALTKLNELSAANNMLSAIPLTIVLCKQLEKLVLSHNRISIIPQDIGEMESLTVLELGANSIQILPLSIASLHSLRALGIWDNDLSNEGVPLEIFTLDSLAVFDISGNVRLEVPQDVREKGVAALRSWFIEAEEERRRKEEEEKNAALDVERKKIAQGWVDSGGSAGKYRYLGDGWYEYYNPSRNYFYNGLTGTTQWDRPKIKIEEKGLVESAGKFFSSLFE